MILDQTGQRDPRRARSLLVYQFEDGYDIEQYTEYALKAVETLLSPFGYDLKTLKRLYKIGKPMQPKGSNKNLLEILFEENDK